MSKARRLDVGEWQRECPECGYQNGFHICFHREPSDDEGSEVEVRLICPSCSTVYDVGLRCRVTADR